ncbi:solute carrier family 22 member 6-like [Ruditapes philippinarum]|uniref:solute carrier family 22 member 6-like n=1 Tax=Ruditapes philippinarum TaxID=129788 RepID=UPI00295B7CB0|nr:solute carrier family 22 member 6-like [Ruditapes philippinarum]
MALGMESFPVNIYLTIFLVNLVDLPSVSVTAPLMNRYGRKKYFVFLTVTSGIFSGISGVMQHYGNLSSHSVYVTTISLVLALLAKMTLATGYYALIIYTTELYPTVVRGIGYGFLSTIGRIGAIVSPVLIYLDGILPGTMYFICGVMIVLSTGCVRRLTETNDVMLLDSLSDQTRTSEHK